MKSIDDKVQEYSLKVGEWTDFGGSELFGREMRLIYSGMVAGKAAFTVTVMPNPGDRNSVAYPLSYPTTQRDISSAVSGYKLKNVKCITVLSVDELTLKLQVEKP